MQDAGRSARQLSRAASSGSTTSTVGDPAVEPAAEPQRLPARRRARPARCRRVFRDESKAWVDVVDEVQLDRRRPRVPVGRASATAGGMSIASPRDGRRRRRSSRSSTPTSPTSSALDEQAGWLYFLASPANADRSAISIARRSMDRGAPERVTPGDQPGSHTLQRRAGRPAGVSHLLAVRRAAGDWTSSSCPAIESLRTLTDPSALQAKHRADRSKPPVEFFTVDVGDGVILDGWMLKPSTFDRVAEVSGHRVRLRRAGGADGDRSLGRRPHAVPSRARRGRLRRRQLRQPRHAGAEGRARGGR